MLDPMELPFAGGYVGHIDYELKADRGAAIAKSAAPDDSVWTLATRFLAVDHLYNRRWLVTVGLKGPRQAESEKCFEATSARLVALQHDRSTAAPQMARGSSQFEQFLIRDRAHYLNDVRRCLAQFGDEESYAICLTDHAHIPFSGSSHQVYRRIRRMNPPPQAALNIDEMHVLCSSPERLLNVDSNHRVESNPIKGTIPRGSTVVFDEQFRRELTPNEKSRAETLMIVDLVENELGRECELGSVTIPNLMVVESYETMHKLVSTITGRLPDDVSSVGAARVCSPGGSMTGAPKVITMETIDSLETKAHGVYSGALSYSELHGAADLNIVIRAIVVRQDQADVGAGGAIVLDSDEQLEWEAMVLRAEASMRSLAQTTAGHGIG